jgi:hypothetical protein
MKVTYDKRFIHLDQEKSSSSLKFIVIHNSPDRVQLSDLFEDIVNRDNGNDNSNYEIKL